MDLIVDLEERYQNLLEEYWVNKTDAPKSNSDNDNKIDKHFVETLPFAHESRTIFYEP